MNLFCFQNIHLTFSTFHLEGGRNCPYDSVKIYRGETDNAELVSTLCSTINVPYLVTTGNVAFIHFHSDSSVQNIGFILDYTTEEDTSFSDNEDASDASVSDDGN